jgi:hypothetical protein
MTAAPRRSVHLQIVTWRVTEFAAVVVRILTSSRTILASANQKPSISYQQGATLNLAPPTSNKHIKYE